MWPGHPASWRRGLRTLQSKADYSPRSWDDGPDGVALCHNLLWGCAVSVRCRALSMVCVCVLLPCNLCTTRTAIVHTVYVDNVLRC